MTEPHDPIRPAYDGAPDEDPDQAEVSGLLAEAGGPVAMPADVTARLDDVLAGLVAERAGPKAERSEPSGQVLPLAPRRPRRWPRVLVAAAAVSVLGYAGGTLLDTGGGGQEDNALTAGAGDSAAESLPSPSGDERDGDEPQDAGGGRAQAPGSTKQDTARAALESFLAVRLGAKYDISAETRSGRCALPRLDTGDRADVVRVDGERVVVVVRDRATPVAEVYPCHQPYLPTTVVLAVGLR